MKTFQKALFLEQLQQKVLFKADTIEMYVSELKEIAECLSQIDNMLSSRVIYEKILPNLDCCCIPPIKAVEKTNDNFPFSS